MAKRDVQARVESAELARAAEVRERTPVAGRAVVHLRNQDKDERSIRVNVDVASVYLGRVGKPRMRGKPLPWSVVGVDFASEADKAEAERMVKERSDAAHSQNAAIARRMELLRPDVGPAPTAPPAEDDGN